MLNLRHNAKSIFLFSIILILGVSGASLAAEKVEPVIVDGDKVEMFSGENKVEASGNVVIIYKESKLTCDKITVNTQTKNAEAFGNVRIESDGSIILAEKAQYNLDTKTGKIYNGRLYAPPYYARADFMEKISQREVKLYKGYFTTCDREKPHYRLKSKEVTFALGEKVTAKNITFTLYNSALAAIPQYVHPLNDNRPRVTVTPGMSKDWGVYLLTAWRYYFNENLRGRIHLDYRERKDFASGFDAKYDTKLFGEGFLRTYYMHERNVELKRPWKESLVENIKEELLKDENIDEVSRNTTELERYRISLRHNWDIDKDTSLKLEYSRLSDANFLGDYFFREQEKGIISSGSNAYILFTRLMPFSTFSVLAQKRANRFMSETEKLPEVKIDVSNTEIGETNFYYSGTTSAVNFNSKAASPSDLHNHVNRIDTYNQLSYPKKIGFVETSPFVALRETYYDRDSDSESDNTFRGIFSSGIDLSTKFYRIFDVETNFFKLDINKLRHVVTPSIGYKYVHEPTVPSDKFYAFDSVDSISKSNSASLGIENKLQTKRGGKSADLARFLLDTNYDFNFSQGSRFANLNFDLEVTPYEWLRFEADSEYDRDDRAIKAANFDLALTGAKEKDERFIDEYNYFLGAGYRYSRNNSNQFTTELMYRLNENWKFRVYERWERETGGFREQEYTIYKELHCWRMEVTYRVKRDYGEEIFFVFKIKAFPENGVEFNNSYHRPKAGQLSY